MLADLTEAHPLIVLARRLVASLTPHGAPYLVGDRKEARRLIRAAVPGSGPAGGVPYRGGGNATAARSALARLGLLPPEHVPAVAALGTPEADTLALELLAGADPTGRLCWWWPRANLRGLLLAGVPLETLRSAMAGARAAGRNPWREVRRLWPAEE